MATALRDATWWNRMRTSGWLAVAVVLIGAASCPKAIQIDIDTKFSANLVRPAATWPPLDQLTPAELDAYEKFGAPDFFHLWYNRRGDLVSSREAHPFIREKKLDELPRSWVYEAGGFEIRFLTAARFEKQPISDKIKVICLRGDPQDVDRQRMRNGDVKEYWTYFDVGEKYLFVNDRQAGEPQIFKGMNRRMNRL